MRRRREDNHEEEEEDGPLIQDLKIGVIEEDFDGKVDGKVTRNSCTDK